MILTSSNLVHYLLERRLLSIQSVVDGDVMVVPATSRNRNFKVIRRQSGGYFVKQIQNWDAQSVGTLLCEATCYARSQGDDVFAPLAPFIPRYFAYDQNRHVLVIELMTEGESLYEYHRRLGKFPLDAATELGKALATYHTRIDINQSPRNGGGQNTPQYSFPRNVPWALSIHQQIHSPLNRASGGSAEVFQILQEFTEFHQTLDALRSEWKATSLIHGDLKLENCTVFPEDGSTEKTRLKLVDWELADFGDPLWDAGGVFQSFLSTWIFSIPTDAAATPSELAARARYPLESMQPQMRQFWRAYVEGREAEAAVAREWLVLSVRYAAARMIQTVYEYMLYSAQATQSALFLLQVSLNILKNPRAAVGELLGM